MDLDEYDKINDPIVRFGWSAENKIYVELTAKGMSPGSCLASFEIMWVPHFAEGGYAPSLQLESSDIKFLALYPDILNIFLEMQGGELSSDHVLKALEKIGQRKDIRNVERGIDVIVNARIEAEFKAFMGITTATV